MPFRAGGEFAGSSAAPGGGGGGSGTVTSVSVATANGFAGTVANPTTTPAITLEATPTGILKSNGTAIAAAVANTDYLPVASPAMTGVPTAPTAAGGTNTTQLATTAFVVSELGVAGWPANNSVGTGNLVATTGSGDITGYNFNENGSGGFNVTTATSPINLTATAGSANITGEGLSFTGTGGDGIVVATSGAAAPISFQQFGGLATAGMTFVTQSTDTGGLVFTDQGIGGIHITTTGGGASTGITLTTQATDTAGITLSDSGVGGVNLVSTAGTGGISITDNGAGLIINENGSTANDLAVQITNAAASGTLHFANIGSGNILVTKAGSAGGITLETTGGGATTGIMLTTQATDTGGIGFVDSTSTGIFLLTQAAGPINLAVEGTGSVQIATNGSGTTGIKLTTGSGDTGGIVLDDAGSTFGIQIGSNDIQKVAFYGSTPVAQAAAITSPTGGATIDTEARTAIDAILVALNSTAGVGITV